MSTVDVTGSECHCYQCCCRRTHRHTHHAVIAVSARQRLRRAEGDSRGAPPCTHLRKHALRRMGPIHNSTHIWRATKSVSSGADVDNDASPKLRIQTDSFGTLQLQTTINKTYMLSLLRNGPKPSTRNQPQMSESGPCEWYRRSRTWGYVIFQCSDPCGLEERNLHERYDGFQEKQAPPPIPRAVGFGVKGGS